MHNNSNRPQGGRHYDLLSPSLPKHWGLAAAVQLRLGYCIWVNFAQAVWVLFHVLENSVSNTNGLHTNMVPKSRVEASVSLYRLEAESSLSPVFPDGARHLRLPICDSAL